MERMPAERAAAAAIPEQPVHGSDAVPVLRSAARPGVSVTDPARSPGPSASAAQAGSTPAGSSSVRGGPSPATEAVRGEHVHSEPDPPRAPQRHSVRAQVLSALREALLGGELVPGEVYSAPALAARFGVSATPVREAMQQLASEGEVETVPNRGFRVAERTPRELAELAEVRTLLEIPVVLAIARSRSAECWETLRPLAEAVTRRASRGDLAGYVAADQAFHRGLVEQGGNRQLALLVEELCRRGQRHVLRADQLKAHAGPHEALLEALSAGDLATAEALLREMLAGSESV